MRAPTKPIPWRPRSCVPRSHAWERRVFRQGAQPYAFYALFLAFAFLAGCGSIGEPLYPALNVPTRVSDLSAVERGDKIDVRFTIPPLTTEGMALKEIGSVELRIGSSPAGGFQAGDWAAAAQRIEVPPPAQPGAVQSSAPVKDFVGKEVVVGVRVGNAKGRMSEWSNFVTVMVETPLATPADFRAEPVPQGVRVTWNAPGAASFRIYRKEGEQKEPALLATVDKPEYVDTSTEYGKTYEYYVEGVHDKTESDVAQSNSVTPKDIFPPAVPTGLTASAGVGTVELAWERNTEADFKEYRVLRSEENGPFVQIAEGLDAPAYSDHKVESGKRYRYRISALDQVGNQSQPSEPVEVTVP